MMIWTSFTSFVEFVVVELVFYGPSTQFTSFRALSDNLATLFLGKPLPVLSAHSLALTTALLESAEGRE